MALYSGYAQSAMRRLLQRLGRIGACLDLITVSSSRRIWIWQQTVKITVFAVNQYPVTAGRLREHP
jgi:hypothetical protein